MNTKISSNSKIVILITIIIFIIFFSLFTFLPRLTIIEDPIFAEVNHSFLIDGHLTKTKDISFNILANETELEKYISELDSQDDIVFSPLTSKAIEKYNFSPVSHSGIWIGLSTEINSFFDFVLVDNPITGWKDAINDKQFQFGLIWSKEYEETANQIKEIADSKYLNEYFQELPIKSFYYSSVQEEMEKDSVIQVLCPGISRIDGFFKDENKGIGWIIDYSFINAVDEESLVGIVEPNLSLSLNNLLDKKNKNSLLKFPLYYKFSKKRDVF